MRSDIVPGGTFPDYELPDHTNVPRRLSELQGVRRSSNDAAGFGLLDRVSGFERSSLTPPGRRREDRERA